jgi:hypothetical protein
MLCTTNQHPCEQKVTNMKFLCQLIKLRSEPWLRDFDTFASCVSCKLWTSRHKLRSELILLCINSSPSIYFSAVISSLYLFGAGLEINQLCLHKTYMFLPFFSGLSHLCLKSSKKTCAISRKKAIIVIDEKLPFWSFVFGFIDMLWVSNIVPNLFREGAGDQEMVHHLGCLITLQFKR